MKYYTVDGRQRGNCCTRRKKRTKIELRNAWKTKATQLVPCNKYSSKKMAFKAMIELFTQALKEIREANSAVTDIVRKAAKAQERGKIRKWCGNTNGRRTVIRVESPSIGHYLVMSPLYPYESIRNVFRVPRDLFGKLPEDHMFHSPGTWETGYEAVVGKKGVKNEIKVIACIRLLGTGSSQTDGRQITIGCADITSIFLWN